MKHSLYDILNVSPQATGEEIKHAFFLLVSQHPPEKEPEKFRIIRSAYETLSDPQARESYDSMNSSQDEVQSVLSEIELLKFNKDWNGAIKKLKEVLETTRHTAPVRNQLGLCYLNAGDYPKAQEEFSILTQKHPGVSLYWNNLGYSFKLEGDSLGNNDPRKADIYEKARKNFIKAVELKTTSSQPFLALSDIYLGERNYSRAVDWAERAVQADGQVDFQDFEAMFQICKIHIFSENEEEIASVVGKILSVVPDDEEYRRYVSGRFRTIGNQLLDFNAFKSALHLFEAARTFLQNDKDLEESIKLARKNMDIFGEYEKFAKDKEIIEPLKKMGALDYSKLIKKETPGEDTIIDDIRTHIQIMSIDSIVSSIEVIKNKYPGIYGLNQDFYSGTVEKAKKRQENLAQQGEGTDGKTEQSGTADKSSENKKKCFVATAVFDSPNAPVVEKLRNYRDNYLVNSPAGRCFIRMYNFAGPVLAEIVSRNSGLKRFSACVLKQVSRILP
jgi:tetratricopeptide (TPR) repeat protein